MTPQKLRFALEQIQANQWERFEQFASATLASEFPNLRTVAGSGERGRDAELYEPTDEPTTKLQYSVTADWKDKIQRTARTLKEHFPGTQELIYVTNQKIGPAQDAVKRTVRQDYAIFVDVRDREWFVERYAVDAGKAAAADALVADIATPILEDRGVLERKAVALSSAESRAACVHLALQFRDDSRDKGLTKLCFEALVRAALRDTTDSAPLSRDAIRERVAALVPATSRERSDILCDAALKRLQDKKAIRYSKGSDSFHLSHEERARVTESVASVALAEVELLEAIDWEVARTCEAMELPIPPDIRLLTQCVRQAVETMLLQQGEAFASAVTTGGQMTARAPDVESAARTALASSELSPGNDEGRTLDVIAAATRVVLTEPADPVQEYFRSLADAYTLFSFLRETSDVQSSIVKLFSVGEIWLDTSVILPLLAETLVEGPSAKRFTNMFRSAVECGLTLHLTPGVLEEIERHTWNALLYARTPADWNSRVPFLAATFSYAGRPLAALANWMEEFRGRQTPSDDLAEYLLEEHGIAVSALDRYADMAPEEIRIAVQEVWQEAHDRRRFNQLDPATRSRLVNHDLENYLGVIYKRESDGRQKYGHKAWWLTLDRTAFDVREQLFQTFGKDAPDSPVMSPDFMVSYLTIGPLRGQLQAASEAKLPLSVADLGPAEHLPRELINEAEKIRAELHGKNDRVVRRQLREYHDTQRRRVGARAKGGMALVQRELEDELST